MVSGMVSVMDSVMVSVMVSVSSVSGVCSDDDSVSDRVSGTPAQI